jgi:hypothetical protein
VIDERLSAFDSQTNSGEPGRVHTFLTNTFRKAVSTRVNDTGRPSTGQR